jgi:hypothetical protein
MTPTVTHSDGLLGSDTALLSTCGTYRYELTRGPLNRPAVFVMLNPSTADASIDDPTIRRCRGFARAWGCGGLVVVNAFALRATNPAALRTHPDPVGPYNDAVLATLGIARPRTRHRGLGSARDPARPGQARPCAAARCGRTQPMCLGVTKDGHPRHPLYVRGATTPCLYEARP